MAMAAERDPALKDSRGRVRARLPIIPLMIPATAYGGLIGFSSSSAIIEIK
jgi:hypothetical protein